MEIESLQCHPKRPQQAETMAKHHKHVLGGECIETGGNTQNASKHTEPIAKHHKHVYEESASKRVVGFEAVNRKQKPCSATTQNASQHAETMAKHHKHVHGGERIETGGVYRSSAENKTNREDKAQRTRDQPHRRNKQAQVPHLFTEYSYHDEFFRFTSVPKHPRLIIK